MQHVSGSQGSATALGLRAFSMPYVITFSAGDVQACAPSWTGATATDSTRLLTTGWFQGSRGPIPTGNLSPQAAVALERTVGTVSSWRRLPDLKDVILLHEHLPEPRRQEFVYVGEFVEGTL
jgi:hypothetical protein